MTWDDHDIIDGYGSFDCNFQNTLNPLFDVARKYYCLFQLRTISNTTIINSPEKQDLNQWLLLRNYLVILPDTRSYRTKRKILIQQQYDLLKTKFNTNIQIDKYTLLFIIPVPIAHLDFSSVIEFFLKFWDLLKGSNFNKFSAHDIIDHWDHRYHKKEQKKMMDVMFDSAEKIKAKKLIIVSGDVHSAGASTIFKLNDPKRTATQIITSPIVNDPAPVYIGFIGRGRKKIDGFLCELKHFGKSNSKLFYKRNFLIINDSKTGLKAQLVCENKDGSWTNELRKNLRSINKFIGSKSTPSNRPNICKLFNFNKVSQIWKN